MSDSDPWQIFFMNATHIQDCKIVPIENAQNQFKQMCEQIAKQSDVIQPNLIQQFVNTFSKKKLMKYNIQNNILTSKDYSDILEFQFIKIYKKCYMGYGLVQFKISSKESKILSTNSKQLNQDEQIIKQEYSVETAISKPCKHYRTISKLDYIDYRKFGGFIKSQDLQRLIKLTKSPPDYKTVLLDVLQVEQM